MVQHIRPWKIMGALQHLKTVERNPHFEDIVINENWQEDAWCQIQKEFFISTQILWLKA
jgi:hypothetical protein